jgi:hypothetical protein
MGRSAATCKRSARHVLLNVLKAVEKDAEVLRSIIEMRERIVWGSFRIKHKSYFIGKDLVFISFKLPL